jgi:hypothetical protein
VGQHTLIAENWAAATGFAVCTLDNILVLFWKAPPAVEGIQSCQEAARALREANPDRKFGFLTYVDLAAQDGVPPETVRVGLSRFLRTHHSALQASVIIYEETGFKATIVRSVVTAIQRASSAEFPAHLTSTRTEGVYWLLQQMRGMTAATPSDLLDLLAEGLRPEPGLLR